MDKIDEKLDEIAPLDPFETYELKDFASTDCQHEYILSEKQDPNTNLLSVQCVKCPAGISIDGDKFKIVKGKIEKR